MIEVSASTRSSYEAHARRHMERAKSASSLYHIKIPCILPIPILITMQAVKCSECQQALPHALRASLCLSVNRRRIILRNTIDACDVASRERASVSFSAKLNSEQRSLRSTFYSSYTSVILPTFSPYSLVNAQHVCSRWWWCLLVSLSL